MRSPPKRRASGVSLVEALVAMAVMGIGMLGMVGLQATLRGSSDIARQRSEAVRFAQQAIEEWRAVTALGATADQMDYAEIGNAVDVDIVGVNATYSRRRDVVSMDARTNVPERDTSPRAKSLRVTVAWVDRYGEHQSVSLSTVIAGIVPELAATLAVSADGGPVRRPFGRHWAIPVAAKRLGKAHSAFKPPGAPATVAWRFENETALITLCTADAGLTNDTLTAAALHCGSDRAMLLTGHVRHATTQAQPGTEEPTSDPLVLEVWVDRTAPSALRHACYVQSVTEPSKYTAYQCAVPVVVPTPPAPTTWSGRTYFKPDALFADAGGLYKVCRYFGDGGFAAGGTYSAVSTPLANQNFLVILAANDCPNPPTAPNAHQSLPYPGA